MPASKRNVTSIARSKKKSEFNEKLSVVIPAAGMGHRMKSYGPKALIDVGKNLTLIERQIKIIWKLYPGSDIFITVGFDAGKITERLKKYPVRFIHNPLHDKTNVLYSIGLAMQACVTSSVMIVYGDLIFNDKALKNLVDGKTSKIVVEDSGMMDKREVGVICEKGLVQNLSFGLNTKWCQIAYLSNSEMEMMKEMSIKTENSQWLGYEALNHMIDNGARLEAVKPKSIRVIDLDFVKDLERISKIN